MTKLQSIQPSAQHVVTAIAAAMGVDVGMIDTRYRLVATSKTFLEKRGTDINQHFVEGVFDREVFVLPNPGYNKLCAGCRYEGNCPESAELLRVIRYNQEIIGVILMIAYTRSQKEKLLNHTAEWLEFIGAMANLLCNEIKLKENIEKEKILKRHLETTVNFANNGMVTINEDGLITQINDRAAQTLKVSKTEILGKALQAFLPFRYFAPLLTERRSIRGVEIFTATPKKTHCIISGNPVIVREKMAGAVISIKNFNEVRSDLYDFAEKQLEYTFDDIYGDSSAMRHLKEYARQIAPSPSTILIQGESGTGKELFARAIHASSTRAAYPFVPINCAAIPEALLESELFGYDGGAFSGAKKGGKPGKFELATGGTIFLDEIGDMPLHMQAKLLRVLQGQTLERVGGIKTIPINVRVIAATNQDLAGLVKDGQFRKDLFFRLNVMPLVVPPLRDRKKDIQDLAQHFLAKYNQKNKKSLTGLTRAATDVLMSYYWPGNVRELENAIEYAVNVEEGQKIAPASLPPDVHNRGRIHFENIFLASRLREYEKLIIREALDTCGTTVEGKKIAARELGISLPTLYRRIKELKLGNEPAYPPR